MEAFVSRVIVSCNVGGGRFTFVGTFFRLLTAFVTIKYPTAD
jgi:hypothetical protein